MHIFVLSYFLMGALGVEIGIGIDVDDFHG